METLSERESKGRNAASAQEFHLVFPAEVLVWFVVVNHLNASVDVSDLL